MATDVSFELLDNLLILSWWLRKRLASGVSCIRTVKFGFFRRRLTVGAVASLLALNSGGLALLGVLGGTALADLQRG